MADSIMSTKELFKFLFNIWTRSNRFIAISYDLNWGPNTSFGPTLGLNFGPNLGPIQVRTLVQNWTAAPLGAEEVSWDYVLFIGLDLRIVGVSWVSKDVVTLICGIGDSPPMSLIQGLHTRIMSYFPAVSFRLVWVLRFECWVLFAVD
jgi:hypothetical protein